MAAHTVRLVWYQEWRPRGGDPASYSCATSAISSDLVVQGRAQGAL